MLQVSTSSHPVEGYPAMHTVVEFNGQSSNACVVALASPSTRKLAKTNAIIETESTNEPQTMFLCACVVGDWQSTEQHDSPSTVSRSRPPAISCFVGSQRPELGPRRWCDLGRVRVRSEASGRKEGDPQRVGHRRNARACGTGVVGGPRHVLLASPAHGCETFRVSLTPTLCLGRDYSSLWGGERVVETGKASSAPHRGPAQLTAWKG